MEKQSEGAAARLRMELRPGNTQPEDVKTAGYVEGWMFAVFVDNSVLLERDGYSWCFRIVYDSAGRVDAQEVSHSPNVWHLSYDDIDDRFAHAEHLAHHVALALVPAGLN